MPSASNNQTSFIERMMARLLSLSKRSWIGLILVVALLGSAIYGLARVVNPGSQAVSGVTLTLSPSTSVLPEGTSIDIDIMLNTAGQKVVAVAAYLNFNDGVFDGAPAVLNIDPDNIWSTTGPTNGITGGQVEAVVGEPTPGINGASIRVATLTLTVGSPVPDGLVSQVVFDSARSAVILDDGLGTNILSEVTDGGYIVGNVGLQSCRSLGGDICGQNKACGSSELIDDDLSTICCARVNGQNSCGPLQGVVRITQGPAALIADCNVSSPEVAINWSTDIASDSQVAYSEASCPGCSWDEFVQRMRQEGLGDPVIGPDSIIAHSVILSGLQPNTGYFYRVRSFAGGLTAASSGQDTFFTGCGGVPDEPFEIRNLSIEPKERSAIVSWNTTKAADSEVFDLVKELSGGPPTITIAGNEQGLQKFANKTLTLSHSLRVPALLPSTKYCLKAGSTTANYSAPPPPPEEVAPASGKLCFVTKEEDLSLNANTVLKVNRDRICGQWLSCESSVEVQDNRGEAQTMCFDRALCDKLDPGSGACLSFVRVPQVNQVFTQIHPDAQRADPTAADPETRTVDELALLSGYSKVGLSFTGFVQDNLSDGVIEGLYPYAAQSQVGSSLNIPNGDFETEHKFPWEAWRRDSNPKAVAEITNVADRTQLKADLNRVLQVSPKPGKRFSGTRVPLGQSIRASTSDRRFRYYVTLDARSDNKEINKLRVQFGYNDSSRFPAYAASDISVASDWQRFIVGPFEARLDPDGRPDTNDSDIQPNTQSYLHVAFETTGVSAPYGSFFIDNVHIEPVLETSSAERIAASCRLYPSDDAPSCSFFDSNTGRLNQGWEGYCVETDPLNPRRCIQWYPVDIISGSSSVLSSYAQAGYDGRTPLYYCTEARGNAPYERTVPTNTVFSNNNAAKCDNRGSLIGGVVGGVVGGLPGAIIGELPRGGSKNSAKFLRCLSGNTGWENYSGLLRFSQTDSSLLSVLRTTDGTPLNNFKAWEIEQIVAVATNASHADWPRGKSFSMNASNNWEFASCTGEACDDDDFGVYTRPESSFYWQNIVASGEESPDGSKKGCNAPFGIGKSNANLFGIKFNFDKQGNLTEVLAGLCDASDGHGWVELEFEVYLREWCTQVAQVVNPFGANTAWAGRVANQSHIVPGLEYGFDRDLEPFGGIVAPEPDFDPAKWDGSSKKGNQPLYVEPPNKRAPFTLAPHQARASSPYGVSPESRAIGTGFCVSGKKLGTSCERHSDCGTDNTGTPGRCTGVVPPEQALSEDEFISALQSASSGSLLSNIFARSQQVWEWDNRTRRYISGEEPGTGRKFGCNAPGKCDNGLGWDVTSDQSISTPPRIQNLKLNAQGITYEASSQAQPADVTFAQGFGTVTISFNSIVSSEQLPLVRYVVDWGDGTVSEEANLKVAAQIDPDKPHVLSHTYTKLGGPYVPRIQIEDNWGWCSGAPANGTANYSGRGLACDSWDLAPVSIFVDEKTVPGPGPGELPLGLRPPTVKIVSPGVENPGISGSSVEVEFAALNWTIGGKGEDHIHFWLDNDPSSLMLMFYSGADNVVELNTIPGPTPIATWIEPSIIRFNSLAAGEHTVTANLVNTDHSLLLNPEAQASVTFTVSGR